jgi:CHRD domain
MGRRRLRYAVPVVLALSLVGASLAIAAGQGPKQKHAAGHHSDRNQFETDLIGHNEVPAVHTKGTGHLTLKVSDDQKSISYTLTYSGLNSSPVLFAHVHVAQPNVNGSVSFFLCGGGGKPACPNDTSGGPVTGTVTAADVIGITSQGMPAGDLDAILQEIRDGFAYANVHTQTSPGGEIRGQLDSSRHHGHDDDD